MKRLTYLDYCVSSHERPLKFISRQKPIILVLQLEEAKMVEQYGMFFLCLVLFFAILVPEMQLDPQQTMLHT